MKLRDWIKRHGLTQVEVGLRLGMPQGQVSELVNQKTWPTRETFQKIWKLTKGHVTPNDFLWLGPEPDC